MRFFFSKNAQVPLGCFGVTTRLEVDGSVAEGEERPKGVNMTELADLLIEHGAVEGINLDGGQKTQKTPCCWKPSNEPLSRQHE